MTVVALAALLSGEPATVKDCRECPEMVVVPAGRFDMGGTEAPELFGIDERPRRPVTLSRPFAIGKFEVTYAEWDACVAARACPSGDPDEYGTTAAGDEGWGRGRRPVVNVSWNEAQAYVTWLSARTGQRYRLPSEAEWEYAARGGVTGPFTTGDAISGADANIGKNDLERTVPVGSFPANAFGLHDVHGNAYEWVQDCYREGYRGAPDDGTAREIPGCDTRMMRGGSFNHVDAMVRLGTRNQMKADMRIYTVGFRVARDLGAGEGGGQ